MAGSISGQLLESLTVGRVVVAILAFLLASFVVDLALKPRYPKTLPRVGYGESSFATLRNWIGYVLYFGEWVDEGYEKVRESLAPGNAASVPEAPAVPRILRIPRIPRIPQIFQR